MPCPLSPETLVYGLTNAGDPQVSPDGRRLVYTLSHTDQDSKKTSTQLWLAGIDGADPRRLTWSGERNAVPRWSPDGRRVAFVSDRVAERGIFLLSVEEPGEGREITRHRQEITGMAWSPDGRRLAYTTAVDPANPAEEEGSADAAPPVRVTRRIDYKQDNRGYLGDTRQQVFVVDVDGGARRQVTTDLVDYNAPQWSPDGSRLAVQVPNHNGMYSQLALIDVGGGETTLVGPETGMVAVWSWSPDGRRLLYAGDEERSPQADFFLYDLATGEARRLTHDLRCQPDAGFPTIAPPAQPVWLDERRALFHGFQAGGSGLYQIDVDSGEVTEVRRWEAVHSGLSADRERRHLAQGRSSLDSVGQVAVFDREAGRLAVAADYNAPLLRDNPPAGWERFEVERAGRTIEAWLLRPPGLGPSRRYPVVLDVHGGPHGHYGYGFNLVQECLATNGFLVVCANPRGSSSYGREFAKQVIGDWGGEDYRDLMTVLNAALQRPYADASRQGIYGYSYGGYMTAWAIGQSDRFQAAVCGAPCFDLESFYGTSDIGHTFGAVQFGAAPHAAEDWYRSHSPSTFAHRVRTPTLIVQGEEDHRCPIGQGEQMFITLLQAGVEVEFARYPGGSHLMLRGGPPEHRRDFLARTLGWFTSHLGGPA